MSLDEYSDDDSFDQESESTEAEAPKRSKSGINPEARRRLEEYYERKSLKQNLADDLFSDYDFDY